MKKISTNIEGLDKLFHGGIYINNSQLEKSSQNDGMIIIIRGPKDCHKTMLALQIAHGLSMSLNCKSGTSLREPRYYSLDKLKTKLEDMYLDILITRQLNGIIELWSKAKLKKETFNTKEYNDVCQILFHQEKTGFAAIKDDLVRLIAEQAVYYNTRTDSLHFRRVYSGDDEDNLYACRKYNTVAEYINEIGTLENDNDALKKLKEEFVNMSFFDLNSVPMSGEDGYKRSKTGIVRFQELLLSLDEESVSSTQSAGKCKAIVIDGLTASVIDTMTFQTLHFEDLLRRMATVSIIVLEGQNETALSGDIVIETRKRESEEDEYSYMELQIAKSVFQSAVLGWHQYKKRDYGIEIFPSIHLLLTKRDYLVRRSQTRHAHVLSESYEQYLGFRDFHDNYISTKRTSDNINEILSKTYLEYDKDIEGRQRSLLDKIYPYKESLSEGTPNKAINLFERILFGEDEREDKDEGYCHGWTDHFSSTAIVGNPNSYKRLLAVSAAFKAASKEEHTLFVLFDKDEVDMRKHLRCPVLLRCRESGECMSISDKCYECHQHLHFFPIRMGCISAEEFFSSLDKYIRLYTEGDKMPKKRFHIVIDDLQRIEYGFPFLKQTSLFLSALINICRNNKVEIKILCDKRAALVNELCSLADNIICIQREEKDLNRMTCYIERCTHNLAPSEVFKMDIPDIETCFHCNYNCKEKKYSLDANNIKSKKIGSMKEYWRKTINITQKGDTNRPEETE